MRYTVRASKRLCVCVRVEAVGQLYTEEEERSSSYASYVYLEVSIYECIVMSLTTLDAATVPAGLGSTCYHPVSNMCARHNTCIKADKCC